MIEVYVFATPNSVKVPIVLEELDLPYALKTVNVRIGEQKGTGFLPVNANSKVPVMVDSDGDSAPFVPSESAAILVYLPRRQASFCPPKDIAHFGWLWPRQFAGVTLDGTLNLSRWYDQIAARPAVQRAVARVEGLVPAA